MAKVALLIGVSEYPEELSALPQAVKDVAALQRVLLDPELGAFDDVIPLLNPDPYDMQSAIEKFFTERTKEDLIVLYFSGHGISDENGNLHFATRLTHKHANGTLVKSSAVAAQFVHEVLSDISYNCSRRQVIILDCCFSGAFGARSKDDGAVNLQGQLGAEGRVVLASSSATQPSQAQSESELSLYTHYLIEGIETGAGDLDEDGNIKIQELHHYVSSRVQEAAPSMTPKLISLKDLGFEIILAKARVTDPQLKYRKSVMKWATSGKIRPSVRALLDTLRQQLGLTQAEADVIEAEVFRPHQERLANLQRYQNSLLAEAEEEYPLSQQAQDAMAMLQKLLGLRDEDIAPIVQQVEVQFAQQIESTEECFKRGLERLRAGSNLSENPEFDEVIRLEPNSTYGYCVQGLRKSSLEDYPGAIADYDEAIRLKPDFTDAYGNRGYAKYALGDKQGAIADFNEVIRLQSDDIRAYFYRGLAKSDLGDKQGAIADYDEAIRLKPDYADAYLKRGTVKGVLGDKQGAIADFGEVICLKPQDAASYYIRGFVKYCWEDKQGAIADYDEAIRLKPDYADAYCYRGLAKCFLGNVQEAIADYDEAIRLKPDYADTYYNRGSAKYALDDNQGALADYNEAIRLKPDYADAYCYRGLAKCFLGNVQEAIADWNAAIRLKPNYADAYYYRGLAKSALVDNQGAIADYDEAIRLKPDFIDAYHNRGLAKSALVDNQGAIADFNKVIHLKPNYAEAYYKRGNAKSNLGDKEGAIKDCQNAAKLYQKQGRIKDYHNVLGQIEKLKDKNKGFWEKFFLQPFNIVKISHEK